MKTIPVLVAIIAISLASCKKDVCYTCYNSVGNMVPVEKCFRTESDLAEYQRLQWDLRFEPNEQCK